MEIYEKRILDLTGADLLALFKEALKQTDVKKNEEKDDDILVGLEGLAEYLRVSVNTVWRHNRVGKYDSAKLPSTSHKLIFSKKKIDNIYYENQ